MKFTNRLEKGVYTTLEQLFQSQQVYGTDDYNEYVYNVIEPLIFMNLLPFKWRAIYETYKDYSQVDFDYATLGDMLLDEIEKHYKTI